MKLPEMPGRIMAQIATAPQKNRYRVVISTSAGRATPMASAAPPPTASSTATRAVQRRTWRTMNSEEATMRPQKKDQISTG